MKNDIDNALDRRGFLRCMAWVGTGAMWTMTSGVLEGMPIGDETAAQASAGATQVVIDNFTFTPGTATVAVGTTVTWTNRDDIPHNVVSTEQKFKSSVLDTDEKFSHTFDTAGSYKYFCSIHPRMTGEIVVR